MKPTFKKPPSRKNTYRAVGRVWTHDGEGRAAKFDDDTFLHTWEFGDIWQGKIVVRYPYAKREHIGVGRSVGFCLEPRKTRLLAMRHLVAWAAIVRNAAPVSVKAFIKKQMKDWPEMYATEEHLIDEVFFVIGNGFDWLDGQVVSLSPDSVDTEATIRDQVEKRMGLKREKEFWEKMNPMLKQLGVDPVEWRKEADQEFVKAPRVFYPVSLDYSLVSTVPDDVLPDWLAWAYKAAKLYRDSVPEKLHDKEGAKLGQKLVANLEKRFPRLLQPAKL